MLKMHQIEEIYSLYDSGYNQSEIAGKLCIDRKTVSSYLDKKDFSLTVKDVAAIHVPRASKLDPYKPIIISKLEELERQKASRKMRWTAVRMHEWLVEEMGITVLSDSYLLVQRFMRKLRDERKKSYRDKGTMPLIWHPGEAQCDFGEADFLSESGQTVTLKYIVLSFPNSNKILSMASPGENCQCVCQCLKDMFEYMGCVPVRIVFDNATGIGKRIQDELQEHEAFTRFRLHYGFEATFTNPYAGQEKGSVENAVGTFRRNRLVPLLTIHGNLETFNRNVMLPLSDAYRMDDEHYIKGRTVRELFEEDRKCMRPLPAADFRVCRVDVCTAHDGLVKLDGKFEYHLDPVVNGKVLVEKTMYTVAFHRMDGKLLEECDRLYDSQEVYYNLPAILNGLVRKTKAWRNSIVREQMEDGSLKDLIDGLADENEKSRLFYCLYHNSTVYGYGETIHAANILAENKGSIQKDDLSVLCSRIASFSSDVFTNPTGVSLDKYDVLLRKAQ